MQASDFVSPDWSAALDLEPLLRACTAEHRIKGLFFEAAHKAATRSGLVVEPGRHFAFKEYPTAEYVRLVGGWVTRAGLADPPRQILRSLGWEAFPAFQATIVGKVILAAAGSTMEGLLAAAGRAYSVSISPGTVAPRVEAKRAMLEIRRIPTFADSFHVGVFEGVLRSYEHDGTVRVRRHSPVDVDLLIEWR